MSWPGVVHRGLVVLALVLASVHPRLVAAGPVVDDDETAATPEGVVEHARLLHDQGKDAFEAADYRTAIDRWARAYAILPGTQAQGPRKVFVLYDLIRALERAHEVDHDVGHLQRARDVLQGFQGSLEGIYAKGPQLDAERARIEGRLASIEALLAQTEVSEESKETKVAPRADPAPLAQPSLPSRRRVRGLIGGGSTMVAVGGAGLAALLAGVLIAQREQGVAGEATALALAGGLAAGIGLVTGSALLTVGLRERRRLRHTVSLWWWRPSGGIGSGVRIAF